MHDESNRHLERPGLVRDAFLFRAEHRRVFRVARIREVGGAVGPARVCGGGYMTRRCRMSSIGGMISPVTNGPKSAYWALTASKRIS
jgi:hypothetical protein